MKAQNYPSLKNSLSPILLGEKLVLSEAKEVRVRGCKSRTIKRLPPHLNPLPPSGGEEILAEKGNRCQFILASKSKRRTEILASCGIRHRVFVTNAKEINHSKIHSAKLVIENARRKAFVAAQHFKSAVALGVDTVVLFKGRNIGKPKSKADAHRMLRAFSGKTIVVYSGLCLIDIKGKKMAQGVEKTILKVRRISDEDIDRFFLRLGPYDRAGAFSIEGAGAIIFDNIRGSYFNVLGLPMGKLAELFKKIGLDILDFME